MKLLTTILVLAFTIGLVVAQAPQAIPFQGAVRNANNVLISNKTITVRFSIHNGSSLGNIVYREWQSTVTNSQGLFVLNVGQGNADIGQFSTINWSDSAKFMQVEIDTTNSKSVWRDIGTQQMLSVPYAFSARKADSANVAINGVPIGTILAFDAAQPPSGYLLCDGSSVSRVIYSSLFALIGTQHGVGNGSTTFNLPDYRGRFLRGLDNSSGNDPDVSARIKGDPITKIGSYQDDAFAKHNHTASYGSVILMNQGAQYGTYIQSGSTTTGYSGGSETRPKNVYVNYIIKY